VVKTRKICTEQKYRTVLKTDFSIASSAKNGLVTASICVIIGMSILKTNPHANNIWFIFTPEARIEKKISKRALNFIRMTMKKYE